MLLDVLSTDGNIARKHVMKGEPMNQKTAKLLRRSVPKVKILNNNKDKKVIAILPSKTDKRKLFKEWKSLPWNSRACLRAIRSKIAENNAKKYADLKKKAIADGITWI